jgi:hypothetical protein
VAFAEYLIQMSYAGKLTLPDIKNAIGEDTLKQF